MGHDLACERQAALHKKDLNNVKASGRRRSRNDHEGRRLAYIYYLYRVLVDVSV